MIRGTRRSRLLTHLAVVVLLAAGLLGAGLAWHRADAPVRLASQRGTIVALAWSPDGRSLAYCGYGDVFGNNSGCVLADAGSGKVETVFPPLQMAIGGYGQGVLGFADANTLILPGRRGSARQFLTLWNPRSGAARGTIRLPPSTATAQSAAVLSIAADRSAIAATEGGGVDPVYVYSLPGLKPLQKIVPPARSGIAALSLWPDGSILGLATYAQEVITVDMASGRQLGVLRYHRNSDASPVGAMAVSPDQRFLAVGFHNGGYRVFPMPGQQPAPPPETWPASPIYLWKLAGKVAVGQPIRLCGPQAQGVQNMVWAPDSRSVIFADGYGSVVSCPISGAAGSVLLNRQLDAVQTLALSPDGTRLAVGAGNRIDIIRR